MCYVLRTGCSRILDVDGCCTKLEQSDKNGCLAVDTLVHPLVNLAPNAAFLGAAARQTCNAPAIPRMPLQRVGHIKLQSIVRARVLAASADSALVTLHDRELVLSNDREISHCPLRQNQLERPPPLILKRMTKRCEIPIFVAVKFRKANPTMR